MILNRDSDSLTAINIPVMGTTSLLITGPKGEVVIGPEDFCELVMYFMTTVDVYSDDFRYLLQERIQELILAEGFNGPHTRKFKD